MLLLRMAGVRAATPRIVDIGCGTGPSAVTLAETTGGSVIAVDSHRPYLAAVRERAEAAGVADRVRTIAASMDDLPLDAGAADLVWAEGSAYVMGFDAALTAWRPLLADGGRLVLTEAEWAVPDPSPTARDFWTAGYPAMRTTAANVEAAWAAGYRVIGTYRLPAGDWDEYYGPLRVRLDELAAQGVDARLIAEVGAEITVYEQAGADYAYTGYVLEPR